ncbi:hypothetical protein D9611_009010 [Ephemerocybe angulata]|uniref:Succinate dehydrogenase [ubiquinone] cytochrome b small subunit n=1 Tax=Ephemerocybe angulata TaxID=980116 RepID=A0A8H5BYX9_9AGAR|nr:hypothetical protein D9611_009010 [Tulosesus angulatus]
MADRPTRIGFAATPREAGPNDAVTLIAHSHIGAFDQCIVDYLHPRKFPIIGPASSWTLRATTLVATVGIFQFNTYDIGLTELIAKVWTA